MKTTLHSSELTRNIHLPTTSHHTAPILTNYHIALSRTGHLLIICKTYQGTSLPLDSPHSDTTKPQTLIPPEDSPPALLTRRKDSRHHSVPPPQTLHYYATNKQPIAYISNNTSPGTEQTHTLEEPHNPKMTPTHEDIDASAIPTPLNDTTTIRETETHNAKERRSNFREARRIYEPP